MEQRVRRRRPRSRLPSNKFYADPTQHPDFRKVQAHWYAKIRKTRDANGQKFKDIEDCKTGGFEFDSRGNPIDADRGGRPLKKWSGNSKFKDSLHSQEPLTDVSTTFPEPVFSREEKFEKHVDFTIVCKSLCEHGNSKLSYIQIAHVWEHYVNGKSYRAIARKYGIHYSQIARLVQKLIEWMNFIGEPMDQEERAVIREYKDSDAAFVFSTWRNALWFDKGDRSDAAGENFYKMVTKRINRMIKRPDAALRIACLSTDRDHIIGCALKIGSCLEWVYVKKDYRKQGIGTLLAGQFTEVSKPVTRAGAAIAQKKKFKIKGEMNGKANDGNLERGAGSDQSSESAGTGKGTGTAGADAA